MEKISVTGDALEINESLSQLQQQLALTQQALQASEARFRDVIEKNADGVIVVDQQGMVRYVNPAAQTLLQRPIGELLGQMLGFPLVAGDTTELDIVRHGQAIIVEMRVGESEWEGQPVFLASLRDITERKQTEEALGKAKRG
jgi:PAS domain-containing protein